MDVFMTLLNPTSEAKLEREVDRIRTGVTFDELTRAKSYVPITLTDKYHTMLCHLAHYQTRHDVCPVTYICIPTVPNNFMHVCFVNIFFYQTCQYLDVYNLILTGPKRTLAASSSSVSLLVAHLMPR